MTAPVCGAPTTSLYSTDECYYDAGHSGLHSWQCTCDRNAYDLLELNDDCNVHGAVRTFEEYLRKYPHPIPACPYCLSPNIYWRQHPVTQEAIPGR